MLKQLRIQEFALIQDVNIILEPGLTAITGETGAGKSIFVAALNFALGAQAGKEMVRRGSDRAAVEACFCVTEDSRAAQILAAFEVKPHHCGLFTVSRFLFANGRNRATINGQPVPVEALKQLRGAMVDLMSQFEQLSLLDPDMQLSYLDLYGGSNLSQFKTRFRTALAAWHSAQSALALVRADVDAARAKKDLDEFQMQELSEANIGGIDLQILEAESRRLSQVDSISAAGQQLLGLLSGETGGASDLLRQAIAIIDGKDWLAHEYSDALALIMEASAGVDEALRSIRSLADRLENDPKRLDEIEATLHNITELKKKYVSYLVSEGIIASSDEIELKHFAQYMQILHARLEIFANADDRIAEAAEVERQVATSALDLAQGLSEARIEAALHFQAAIIKNLKELNLAKTDIRIDVSAPQKAQVVDLTDSGLDRISINISLNPGEQPLPLAKVASGGELSRILLAMKTALNSVDQIPTVVFDEIDVGIGGITARSIGKMLAMLGRRHQILCITHLPQIAAFANNHILIEKSSLASRTVTDIKSLDHNQRQKELARMLSGDPESRVSLEQAETLMRESGVDRLPTTVD